jgi:phenylacetate-CoA ligase
MHVNEDHFLVELIDPETTETVAPGAVGELVITTLTREAMPLVRYRTGDLASLCHEPCGCGRTTARTLPVLGRRADELQVRGVHFFPSQVERVLLAQPGVGTAYRIVVSHGDVEVHIEAPDASVAERVRAALRARIGSTCACSPARPARCPGAPARPSASWLSR